MEPERPTADQPATLQTRLEAADDDHPAHAAAATVYDPVALLHRLDVSGHFHRDSRFGRLFHRGMVSLRENVPANSLHVSIDANRLLAHVDRVSPLTKRSDGSSAYSVRRALAHNLTGMAQDALWLLRGRQGDHQCELDCEWLAPADRGAVNEAGLLDPRTGAWSVALEARVAGALNAPRLRAALGTALGSQTFGHDPLDVVECPDDDALDAARQRLQRMGVPLTQFPPMRACLARHPAGDVLMLALNHAATDAFAAIQVLRAIARAYAGETNDAQLDFLATHDLPIRPHSRSVPAVLRAHKQAVEWLRDRVDRAAHLAADGPSDQPGSGFHLVALSAEDTAFLVGRNHARANTNVLMAALHLAIADWNRRHDGGGRRIGVLVHADLRPPEWDEDPVANFSVTARVSTARRARRDAASALRSVTARIARNKRTRTGVALIAALARADLLVLWAKQSIVVLQPLTGNHQVDTTVLCNLGWLDEAPSFGAGDGDAVALWFSPPARAPLSLCLGAVTIGERLHMTFRYPHRLFGPEAAQRFADIYVQHLRSVAVARNAQPIVAQRSTWARARSSLAR